MNFETPHRLIFSRILTRWFNKLPSDGLILEIGCGLGSWIGLCIKNGYKIIGLDNDEQACSIASSQFGRVSKGIVLYSGNIFPFESNSIQGVLAHEVLEHVTEDKQFVAEANRILEDGGLLILTTPNGNREPLDKRKHSAHVRHYVEEQLNSLLMEHGFTIEKRYWRMHPICGLLDDALSRLGNELIQIQPIQPGLTYWRNDSQSRMVRFLLWVYKLIEPFIAFVVTIEFEIFKTILEARNIILIANKRTNIVSEGS